MTLSLTQPTVQHAHHKKIEERRHREGSKEEGQPKDKQKRRTGKEQETHRFEGGGGRTSKHFTLASQEVCGVTAPASPRRSISDWTSGHHVTTCQPESSPPPMKRRTKRMKRRRQVEGGTVRPPGTLPWHHRRSARSEEHTSELQSR